MDDNESGTFSAGFFIGAVAGVLIGFLIAPMAGKELRENIRERAGAGLNRAREAAAGVAGAARKLTRREK
jgi:gas vesicle protein